MESVGKAGDQIPYAERTKGKSNPQHSLETARLDNLTVDEFEDLLSEFFKEPENLEKKPVNLEKSDQVLPEDMADLEAYYKKEGLTTEPKKKRTFHKVEEKIFPAKPRTEISEE